jgi:hypothetical protein
VEVEVEAEAEEEEVEVEEEVEKSSPANCCAWLCRRGEHASWANRSHAEA